MKSDKVRIAGTYYCRRCGQIWDARHERLMYAPSIWSLFKGLFERRRYGKNLPPLHMGYKAVHKNEVYEFKRLPKPPKGPGGGSK